MLRIRLLSLVVAMAMASPVVAQGPSFDCSKAKGQVQTLICSDAGLAALDRQLDGVYKAAMAKAKDKMPAQLRSEQRGWIKGRDECWKAQGPQNPVRLTLNWMAQNVRECVEGNYKIRISVLQGTWGLVAAKQVSYACGNPASRRDVLRDRPEDRTARTRRSRRHRVAAAGRIDVRRAGHAAVANPSSFDGGMSGRVIENPTGSIGRIREYWWTNHHSIAGPGRVTAARRPRANTVWPPNKPPRSGRDQWRSPSPAPPPTPRHSR